MLYVYALIDTPTGTLPSSRGHRGARLRARADAGVAAVYTRHEQIALEPSPARLWRHERVTEDLMAQHAVLPVRFGTTVADEASLARMLQDRAHDFSAALARVRGRVELAVRVLWTPPEPAPQADDASPGRTYLQSRLESRQAADRLAQDLHEELGKHAVEAHARVLATPRLLLSGAYLVERGNVDRFVAAADALADRHPDVELLCTGPWPAHHFATASA